MSDSPARFSFSVPLALGMGCALICGCSSGKGNGLPSAADDAFTVARNGSLTVTGLLDNDVDPDGDGLTLVSIGSPSKGTLVDNGGGSYTYTPDTNAFGSDTISYTVSDGRGGVASGTVTITITPGWGSAEAISTAGGAVTDDPVLLVDPAGQVTCGWLQQDGGGIEDVWSNGLGTSGWGTAATVDAVDGNAASALAGVVGSDGRVTFVWQQTFNAVSTIWANQRTSGTWGTALDIDESLNPTSGPVLAIDNLDRLTVLYAQNDGGELNLYSQHYLPTSGWYDPEQIDDTSTDVLTYACTTDAQGNVSAAFLHRNAGNTVDDMWGNHCTPGTGWGTARKVELQDTGSAKLAGIHPDASGNVTFVWTQSDGAVDNLLGTRYTLGSGWVNGNPIEAQAGSVRTSRAVVVDSTARRTVLFVADVGGTDRLFYTQDPGTNTWTAEQRLDTGVGAVQAVRAVVTEDDIVHAVWTQTGATHVDLWSAAFTPGAGWSTPQKIDSEDLGSVSTFFVVRDPDGNVVAAWRQADATVENLWAARFRAGQGWGQAERIEAGAGAVQTLQALEIGSGGVIAAVWSQDVGATETWFAARFDATGGWSTERALGARSAGGTAARLAVDGNGAVTVVWRTANGVQSADFR